MKPSSLVYNVDCLEFMKTIPDKTFDLCIADPPYRDANQPTREMRRVGFSASLNNQLNDEMLAEISRVSKHFIIWGANNYGFKFKGFIAWNKQITGSDRYSLVEIASLSESLSTVSSYVSVPCNNKGGKIHPTQKPVGLYAWMLERYAKEGYKIFDPFLGSGSSRIAAYKMGFDFTGCEIDKGYFNAQEQRFQKECFGIETFPNGVTATQQSLFD